MRRSFLNRTVIVVIIIRRTDFWGKGRHVLGWRLAVRIETGTMRLIQKPHTLNQMIRNGTFASPAAHLLVVSIVTSNRL
jgi:hypothetical protein